MSSKEKERLIPPKEMSWREYRSKNWTWLESYRPDLLENPNVIQIRQWVENKVATLPHRSVEAANLTEEKPSDPNKPYWLAITTQNGQVEKVIRSDGGFFSVEGRKITIFRDNGITSEWIQPLLVGHEEPTIIPTREGPVILPVHGFLGVISDTQERVLMTIKQEAASDNEKFADVVLAIQGSIGNLNLIEKGDPKADQNLKTVLEKISEGNLSNLLYKPELVIPGVAEDPNRFQKHNLLLFPDPIDTSSTLHQELTACDTNRWCTKDEIDALIITGLANGHAVEAIRTWEALRRGKI